MSFSVLSFNRYNRQYRLQSCLVRKSQNVTKATTLFTELGLDHDDVTYSLNKKGRWLVPQILKHEILGESKDLGDIKVDLFESHKLKKQGKCTGFCTNKGFVRRVVPKKTYFNAGSVLSPKRKTDTTPTTPHITVDIVYPCPATSSISHNPKYIRYEDVPSDALDQDNLDEKPLQSNPIKGKSKKQRKRITTQQRVDDYLDEIEYLDNEYSDQDDLDVIENENPRQQSTTVTIEDILHHSRRMEEILQGKAKVSNPPEARRTTKNRVVFIDKEEDTEEEQHSAKLQSSDAATSSILEHVSVNIPTAEVTKEQLHDSYGDNYMECRCFPRKFIIDITKSVQTRIHKAKAFRDYDVYSLDLSTVLVFVYDMFGGLDSTDTDLYKVFLNMKTRQSNLKLDAIFDGGVFTIEEIVNRAASSIEIVPFEKFVPKLSNAYSRPAKTDFEMLNGSRRTATRTIFSENLVVKDLYHKEDSPAGGDESLASLEFELFPPETCSICFESMLDASATALQTCGHWFCDRCWNEHLQSTANGGSGRITCPEYKCASAVDYSVLLTTSNIELVERVFRRKQNLDIDIAPDSKWCPNKDCGRAIKCENGIGRSPNTTCDCGTEMCFDCLRDAHWPLSCDQYVAYLITLRKNGHETLDENLITFVQGKPCPNCKLFVQKNGGCFYMTCVCGSTFCWGCGQAYPNHQLTPHCTPHSIDTSVSDNYRTTKMKLYEEVGPAANTNSYKRAVAYRNRRRPGSLKVMSSAVYGMTRALKNLHCRHGNRIGGELVDFETSKSPKDNSIADKFNPFLNSMIGVYVEICHICEHTIMYSDTSPMGRSAKQGLNATRDRLEDLGLEIFCIFECGSKQDMAKAITSLWSLRFHSRKAVNGLVKQLK